MKKDFKDWCIKGASNSCARTLIFDSFSFIAFLSSFFPAPFSLFLLSVLLPFLHFLFGFLSSFVSPFFFALVLSLFFLAHVVSSLAYPTCLGIKCLVVVVVN
jgi:hypothetical protein